MSHSVPDLLFLNVFSAVLNPCYKAECFLYMRAVTLALPKLLDVEANLAQHDWLPFWNKFRKGLIMS